MELYNDSDRPTLDLGVEKRLRRHNPNLHVTFSRFVIDLDPNSVNCSKPIITKWGALIEADVPSYYLWLKSPEGQFRYVADYRHFDHRAINRLESDMFRRMSHRQAMDRIAWAQEAEKERGLRNHNDKHKDQVVANKSRINDLLLNGKTGKRTAKISSYGGQTNRGTPDQEFLVDPREDGWELDRYEE